MISKLLVVKSALTDPYVNLAIENQLLLELDASECVLFLYVNSPAIVMGRFQNPWLECNLPKLREKAVHLVRRQSGGGCVYHDYGNLNFSFMHPVRELQKETNNQIVINTLKEFGINAYASGRSDLLVNHNGEKKFSGSAFKQKKDRTFHHGTLLINSDLSFLNGLLKKTNLDITNSKSIKSNPSEVINLSLINPSITIESLSQALINQFQKYYHSSLHIRTISNFIEDDYYRDLKDWKWKLGETPLFEIQLAGVKCTIKKGEIIDLSSEKLKSNYLNLKLNSKDLLSVDPSLDPSFHQALSDFIYD